MTSHIDDAGIVGPVVKPLNKFQRVRDSFCPFCNTDEGPSYDDLVVDSGFVSQLGQCSVCDKEWYETYVLQSIEERD